jgi:hypothetical protein
MRFDGVDDFINVSPVLNQAGNSYSVEAWFNANDVTTSTRFFEQRTSGNTVSASLGISFGYGAGIVGFSIRDEASTTNIAKTSLNYVVTNRWYHVVGIRDNNNLLVYIDGALLDNVSAAFGTFNAATNASIGAVQTISSGYFNGTIDEIRVYNRSLSSDEVFMHYRSNLRKYAVSGWEFYTNQSGLNNSIYNYTATAADTTGSNNTGVRFLTQARADAYFDNQNMTFNVARAAISVGVPIRSGLMNLTQNVSANVTGRSCPDTANFAGSGTFFQHLGLSGQTMNLTFSAWFVEATQEACDFNVSLYNVSGIEIDRAQLRLVMPALTSYDFKVTPSSQSIVLSDVSNGNSICGESKKTFTIVNNGSYPISDLTISATGDIPYSLAPQITDYYLRNNSNITFTVTAYLNSTTPSGTVDINVTGASLKRTASVSYSQQAGSWAALPTQSGIYIASGLRWTYTQLAYYQVFLSFPMSLGTVISATLTNAYSPSCEGAMPYATDMYFNNNLIRTYPVSTRSGIHVTDVPPGIVTQYNTLLLQNYDLPSTAGYWCTMLYDTLTVNVSGYSAYCPLCQKTSNTETNFTDDVDNDCDGIIDCLDTDSCSSVQCPDNADNDILCPDAEVCDDGIDNDKNGLTDCTDTNSCCGDYRCSSNNYCPNGGWGCQVLNTPSTTVQMPWKVTGSGTCFTINATDIIFDCMGASVGFGHTSSPSYGFVKSATLPALGDFTLRNCSNVYTMNNGYSGQKPVYLEYARNVVISNNHIETHSTGGNAIYLDYVNNALIEDNEIRAGSSSATRAIYQYSNSNNYTTIRRNLIITNGTGDSNSGAYIYSSSLKSVNITDNVINTSGNAYSHGIVVWSNNTVIRNNRITGNASSYYFGIYDKGSSSSVIENNTVTFLSTDILAELIYWESSNNIIIANNTLTSPSVPGASYAIMHGYSPGYRNGLITNNTMSSTGKNIWIDYLNNYTISNNRFLRNATSDYQVMATYGSDNTIKDMTIHASATAGLYTYGDNYTIQNITVLAHAGYGMDLGSQSNALVKDSQVLCDMGVAMGVNLNNGRNYTFENNTLRACYRGFVSGASSNNATIRGNNITTFNSSSAIYGAYLDGLDHRIINNTFTMNSRGPTQTVGIELYASRSTISDNRLQISGVVANNYGIHTYYANNLIENNTVSTYGTTTNYGIFLDAGTASNNVVRYNTVTTNGSVDLNYGIYARLQKNDTIAHNTIATGGTRRNYGIFVEEAGTGYNSTILNNTIRSGGSQDQNIGIYLYGTTGDNVVNNTVRTNGTSTNIGINVVASGSASSRNNVTGNDVWTYGNLTTSYGISISVSGTNMVRGNTVHTNGSSSSHGINIEDAGTGVTQNNTVVNNTIIPSSVAGQANGVRIINAIRSNVSDNTIITGASGNSNYGVIINNTGYMVERNTVRGNIISTNGSQSHGMVFTSTTSASPQLTSNNTVDGNVIVANGTDAYGVWARWAQNNTISGNTLTTYGSGAGIGVALDTVTNMGIAGNTISTQAGSNSHGVSLVAAQRNRVTGNAISATGSNSSAIVVQAGNNTLSDNNITSSATYAIVVQVLNTTVTNTIISQPSKWLLINANTTLTNTSFEQPFATVRFNNPVALPAITDMTLSKAIIGFRGAFVNVSNMTAFNTSAFIVFRDINYLNPQIMVDLDDDGNFTVCPASLCTNISYINNEFYFNISHFTNYSVRSWLNPFLAPVDNSTKESFNYTGDAYGTLQDGTETDTTQTVSVIEKNTGRTRLVFTGLFANNIVDMRTATIMLTPTSTVVNLTGVTGISGTHSLFVPVTDSIGVYVCPTVMNIETLRPSCPGAVKFSFAEAMSGTTKDVAGDSVSVTIGGNLYNVSGLTGTGVAEGLVTNLTIWDQTDSMPYAGMTRLINDNVYFYANFTNASGLPANTSDGGCRIDYNDPYDGYEQMIFNATINIYQANRSYASNGDFAWKVNCTGAGDIISTTDSVHIGGPGPQQVPEFGTIALFLALGVVALGMTRLRKR